MRILREMAAKGEVPLRQGVTQFLDDALAEGAQVGAARGAAGSSGAEHSGSELASDAGQDAAPEGRVHTVLRCPHPQLFVLLRWRWLLPRPLSPRTA